MNVSRIGLRPFRVTITHTLDVRADSETTALIAAEEKLRDEIDLAIDSPVYTVEAREE